jgi:hypothetical protein
VGIAGRFSVLGACLVLRGWEGVSVMLTQLVCTGLLTHHWTFLTLLGHPLFSFILRSRSYLTAACILFFKHSFVQTHSLMPHVALSVFLPLSCGEFPDSKEGEHKYLYAHVCVLYAVHSMAF